MKLEQLDSKQQSELEMMLTLKIRDFRAHQFKNISKDNVKDYLFNVKWKRRDRIGTCDIVNDIFDLTASQVFDYLRSEGIKQASQSKLEDYSDLFFN